MNTHTIHHWHRHITLTEHDDGTFTCEHDDAKVCRDCRRHPKVVDFFLLRLWKATKAEVAA